MLLLISNQFIKARQLLRKMDLTNGTPALERKSCHSLQQRIPHVQSNDSVFCPTSQSYRFINWLTIHSSKFSRLLNSFLSYFTVTRPCFCGTSSSVPGGV